MIKEQIQVYCVNTHPGERVQLLKVKAVDHHARHDGDDAVLELRHQVLRRHGGAVRRIEPGVDGRRRRAHQVPVMPVTTINIH